MRWAYIRRLGVYKEVHERRKGEGTLGKVRRDDEFPRAAGVFHTDDYSRRGECLASRR